MREGESRVLERELSWEASGERHPGNLLVTSQRVIYRTPSTGAACDVLVEELRNVRLARPFDHPQGRFALVIRRDGRETPLQLRAAANDPAGVSADQAYLALQDHVP